jgi:hypothetical protein
MIEKERIEQVRFPQGSTKGDHRFLAGRFFHFTSKILTSSPENSAAIFAPDGEKLNELMPPLRTSFTVNSSSPVVEKNTRFVSSTEMDSRLLGQ